MKTTMVKMVQLCFTGQTLYALDAEGRVWFVELRTGDWDLHGNPTTEDLERISGKPA